MSYNPNYRPSDPPQVGSQQFNNSYGTSQPGYGSGQNQGYGSGQYSNPNAYQQNQSGPAVYNQPNDYGQPGAYGYSQPNSYSQPMTYGAPMMVRPAVNRLSSWAMWMGIIGLGGGFVCSFLSLIPILGYFFMFLAMFLWIAPILAVIFGHVSRGQIKKSGEDGRGQATAGLVMGYVGIGLGLLGLIIIVGVVGLGVFAAAMGY
ncbi:DUF4190 domain-containing protein [Brevibacterium aurantiacum]|uniref:DUF4190 domain-containing protein n=1 Tax=Brevibacterium aurantiacum TaxID=273384 RepID=UPI001F499E62|nr:DUF4190 domain-containing protein [Brevibacterium aurantiacum]